MLSVTKNQHTVGLLVLLAMVVAVFSFETIAYAQQETTSEAIPVPSPGTDLWRSIRDRTQPDITDPSLRNVSPRKLAKDLWVEVNSADGDIVGQTQVLGPDAGALINTLGEQWRQFRMNQLVPVAGYVLGGMLIIIALFRIIRGKIRIKAGRSEKRVKRFSLYQRTTHWTVAITFITLGLTGCILIFGRSVLLPLLGGDVFGNLAFAAKRIHDFVGPVFGIALVVQFILFIKGNMLKPKEDLMWILKGGGMFGSHASSHRYNAGEKTWFWLAMLGGLIVVASGLVLDFPLFGQDRADMSLAHIVHSSGAILILAASFGHIYMGTIAMEGAFEVMATGYCDANWAKEHHDLWYEDVADRVEPYPDAKDEHKSDVVAQTPSGA